MPDHLVLLSNVTIDKRRSLNLPYEDVRLIVVMEYVSDVNPNKDYRESFTKYEQQLRVPYYLTFHPTKQDLRLHVHDGTGYIRVEPNQSGRLEIPELQLEMAILGGWTRYWFRGELLPIPKEMAGQIEQQAAEAQFRKGHSSGKPCRKGKATCRARKATCRTRKATCRTRKATRRTRKATRRRFGI